LGNKNAYKDAAIQDFPEGITTTALRFIPLSYEGEPCMRIEICGGSKLCSFGNDNDICLSLVLS
jgi:hypothetical protein